MVASFNFNAAIRSIVNAYFGSGSFKMLLVSVLPGETEKDAWDFRNDVTNEVVGAGYTAGGSAVTLTVAAVDTVNNDIEVSCSSVSWTSATITAVGGIIYKVNGSAGSDELVSFIDFGGPISSTSGTFTVNVTDPLKFQN